MHPSHNLRVSGSERFDFVCRACHATDGRLANGTPDNRLDLPCPYAPAERAPTTFATLRAANEERQKSWPGADKADLGFRILEVVGEAGELAEAFKKLRRTELGIGGNGGDIQAILDELGDVVIAADLLAMYLGRSLAEVVAAKFNKTSDKYGHSVRL